MDTLGSLVDKLCTVDLKMWNNQEILYAIRAMSFDEFKKKYLSTDEAQLEFYQAIRKCCDLNAQRNQLIDEMDTLFVDALHGKVDPAMLLQMKHKTYEVKGDKDELSIKRLKPCDLRVLTIFFSRVRGYDNVKKFFTPHPLTDELAKVICEHDGHDRFMGVFLGDRIAAYCMLRGWDAGYEIPTFGVVVAPQYGRRGIATMALQYCIIQAKALGAPKLMLSVHKENTVAQQMYEKAGFKLEDKDEDNLVGLLDL